MNLKLFRPVVCFDVESTGLSVEHDRIISIGMVKQFPDGKGRLSREYLMNPGRPISAESTAIHGITDEMVALQPLFETYAQSILDFITGSDLIGFNLLSFDVPMLYHHFMRAGLSWKLTDHRIVDVGNLFKIKQPRTLSAAVEFYTGKEHVGSHMALSDAKATWAVLEGQMAMYAATKQPLPTDVGELASFSSYGNRMADVSGKFYIDPAGVTCFNFGPHKGLPALEHPDYLEWMVSRDFPRDSRIVAERLLDEHYAGIEDHRENPWGDEEDEFDGPRF